MIEDSALCHIWRDGRTNVWKQHRMWLVACTLYLLLTLWPSSLCHSLLTVGPCEVNREKATFNCSRMNLTSVPQHIWPNVTELDLSGNLLNLVHAKSLKKLWHLNSLTKLNLSGNYLPLLVKQHFYQLPSLEILDLSGCRLAAVGPAALQSFPRLQKLYLDNNDLQSIQAADYNNDFQLSDRSDEEARTGPRDYKQRHPHDDVIQVTPNPFQRKLLTASTLNTNESHISINATGTESPPNKPSEGWKYLVAVLVIAISLSVLIAVAAKCKLFHEYLASYRHSRLNEADGASQCDPAAFDVGFSSHGTSGSGPRLDVRAGDMMEEDDDGFIEDNYIQASERERAEREAEDWEHEEEEEEEEMEDIEGFSIG